MWAKVQVKVPGALPLSVAALRGRLRLEDTGEDAELSGFIAAAASDIEGPDGIGVALMAQTWTLALDTWPTACILPGWPVQSLSEIRYLDVDGVQKVQDPAAYRLIKNADPARIVRRAGTSLPPVLAGGGAVEIDYTLGRVAAEDVDPALVTALALMAGHYYEHREAATAVQVRALPMGVDRILARFFRGRFA